MGTEPGPRPGPASSGRRPPGPGRLPGHGQRKDIQGLRAIAVAMVLVYHLLPAGLPGGFVGVDVFFVISGFLIIGSLQRELESTGTLALAAFYARRIRRLMPAATAVLVATGIGAVLFLPESRWQSVAADMAASALQVQNWAQAFGAVSYAEATAAVSPLQHFWSLAVEEQFYLVIPVLLLGAAWLAGRLRRPASSLVLPALTAVTIASFVHSVLFSPDHHELAYFDTTTRLWELGLGGLLAFALPQRTMHAATAAVAGWAGLAMIAWAAGTFSTQMDFPGAAALLPTMGAALVLASGDPRIMPRRPGGIGASAMPAALLSTRPFTAVGDVSYSLYLWHWPVIVLYVAQLGRPPGVLHMLVIVALSGALSVLSYLHIEQRFRAVPLVRLMDGRRAKAAAAYQRSFSLGAGLIALSLVVSAGPWTVVQAKIDQLSLTVDDGGHPGAEAMAVVNPVPVPSGVPIRPDAAVARKDLPRYIGDGCSVFDTASPDPDQCTYAVRDAGKAVVLAGDSHAGQYFTPLERLAQAHGWRLQTMVRNGCPFIASPPVAQDGPLTVCAEHNRLVLDRILTEKPKLVVLSAMRPAAYEHDLKWRWKSTDEMVSAYSAMLRPLVDASIRVAVLADTPTPTASVPECVARHAGSDLAFCSTPKPAGDHQRDPLAEAAVRTAGVQLIDLEPYLCGPDSCPGVIGNVLVFRDNHLTDTFARTLTPAIARQLSF